MEWITDPEIWIALLTLTALEIVLGIDNIIFISILAGKLPRDQQDKARQVGLLMAMLVRIALLFSLSWLVGLTDPLFTVFGFEVTGRGLILIGGGLFLLAKATYEIHDKLENESGYRSAAVKATFGAVLIQIVLLDVVFSLDSVLTAVGMSNEIWVMVTAVIIAVLIMLVASGPISEFVNERPTIKVLALSFLLLVGFSLVAEGLGVEIPKGYIYFAMFFSLLVEMINLRIRRPAADPVHLRQRYVAGNGDEGAAAPAGG
ncbi:MAG: TerC family protein [Anaerolineales bacterium]